MPQLPQALIDGLQQVVGLLFLQHDVGIANDAKQMGAVDVHAWKQLGRLQADDILEKRECLAGRPVSAAGIGMNRGQDVGNLDARELACGPRRRTTTAKFLLRFEM